MFCCDRRKPENPEEIKEAMQKKRTDSSLSLGSKWDLWKWEMGGGVYKTIIKQQDLTGEENEQI